MLLLRLLCMLFTAACGWVTFRGAVQPANDHLDFSHLGVSRNEQYLLAQGYVSVPIVRGKTTAWWYLNCTLNDRKYSFILDTGANTCVMDLGVAKELGIQLESKGKINRFLSGQPVEHFQTIRPRLRVVALTTESIPFEIIDLGTLTRESSLDEMPNHAGLLGAKFFEWYSAVLDYGENKVYLLDPMTPFQGRWRLKAMNNNGLSVMPKHTTELQVKGDRLSFDAGRGTVNYTLGVDNKARPRVMNWTGSNGGVLPGRYQLEKGVLTIAMPLLKPNPPYTLPDTLKGTPGCDFTVMTFERSPNR